MFRLLVACLADDEVLAVMCRWALGRAGGGAGRRPPLQLGLFFWVTMRSFIGLRQPQMHFVLPLLQGLSQETIEFVLSHPSNAYDRCALPAERCAHGSVCAHSACTAPPGEMAAGCGACWTRLLAAVKACRHRPSLTQRILRPLPLPTASRFSSLPPACSKPATATGRRPSTARCCSRTLTACSRRSCCGDVSGAAAWVGGWVDEWQGWTTRGVVNG